MECVNGFVCVSILSWRFGFSHLGYLGGKEREDILEFSCGGRRYGRVYQHYIQA